MSDRERNKLRASELIELIVQVPDSSPKDSRLNELSSKVDGLIANHSNC